jgi:hypothetical protein
VVATCLYWVGHAYAGVLGRRPVHRERLTAKTLARALTHSWAIV